jgi:hypothetical protein
MKNRRPTFYLALAGKNERTDGMFEFFCSSKSFLFLSIHRWCTKISYLPQRKEPD